MGKQQKIKNTAPCGLIDSCDSDEYTVLVNCDGPSVYGSYESIGDPEPSERRGSIISSVFTLVSTMNGGGILSIPFAFQQGGYAVASITMLFACIASAYSAFLIIRSKKYCSGRIKNIEDVAKVAFGKKGKVVAQVVLISFCYMCTVGYLILFVDQMKPLISLAIGQHTFLSNKLSVLTIALLIVFPISLLKNLSALKYTSALSMMCTVFVCLCVAYRSITTGLGGPINLPENPVRWYPKSIGGFLTCIAIIEVAFTCHYNILPMHGELRHSTTSNKRLILIISMVIVYITNFIISFFGYFQFRMFTHEDIMENYPHNDIAVNCGRAALCCSLLMAFPLLIVPCRGTINQMIWNQPRSSSRLFLTVSNDYLDGPSKIVWLVETVLLVLSSYVFAYFIPQITMIWGLVGAVLSTAMIYILPPAFYLSVRNPLKDARLKSACAFFMLSVGFLLLMLGLYQGIVNIISPLPRNLSSVHDYHEWLSHGYHMLNNASAVTQ